MGISERLAPPESFLGKTRPSRKTKTLNMPSIEGAVTKSTTLDWSEENEDTNAVFATSRVTIRTPTKTRNKPIEADKYRQRKQISS